MTYFYVSLFVIPLIFCLKRNFQSGLCVAGFLLVALTSYLTIDTPGNLPKFTIHRIILLFLLVFWLIRRKPDGLRLKHFDLFPQFIVVAIVNFVSMLFSMDFVFSFKTYISFTIEMFLYFAILQASLRQTQSGIRLLQYAYAGLVVTAVLGIIERKTGFNPVDAFLPGYVRMDILDVDVLSTFPHRILFGLGMAMALPLGFGLWEVETGKVKRTMYLLSIPIILLACYFSFSRGPWAAAVVGGAVLFLLGSTRIRKVILLFAVLATVALAAKPGVRATFNSKAQETRDSDSFKGQTYLYRWELWRIAYNEIKRSPKTFFLGTGPGTSEVKSYRTILSYSGDEETIESWDNEYAATLLETGFLGICSVLLLHGAVITKMMRAVKQAAPGHRSLMAAILASLLALLFMMTNVKMFSSQINYLMWILVSAGLVIGLRRDRMAVVWPMKE